MGKLIFCGILLMLSQASFAYTECDLKPTKVWLNLTGVTVWICFEGAACIKKEQSSIVTESHIDRLYSTALAAISRQSNLKVRYNQDGACSDLSETTTSDFSGIWFLR
jgi:hypothetical protein